MIQKNTSYTGMLIYIPVIIFLVTFFQACTKEINYPALVFAPEKLVVNCTFSPQHNFEFYFSLSRQFTSQKYILNDELHLTIYENSIPVIDTTIRSDTLITNYYPKAGCIYKLILSSANFPTIFAQDTVPVASIITNSKFTFPSSTDDYGDYCMLLT